VDPNRAKCSEHHVKIDRFCPTPISSISVRQTNSDMLSDTGATLSRQSNVRAQIVAVETTTTSLSSSAGKCISKTGNLL
jgi:hypothetical protein